MQARPVLVIMAKEPQIGDTKTRLSPPLTPDQATALYRALLQDTIALGSSLHGIDLAVAVTPPEAADYFERMTPSPTRLLPVRCRDIGDCLTRVYARLFDIGYSKVLAFNADGPSLPPEYIHRAVDHLEEADVVFGPAEDGGYYLVGAKKPCPQIFTGIAWSTSRVLSQSLAKCKQLHLKTALLPTWYDVDTAQDLERIRSDLHSLPEERLAHTREFFERNPWIGVNSSPVERGN